MLHFYNFYVFISASTYLYNIYNFMEYIKDFINLDIDAFI